MSAKQKSSLSCFRARNIFLQFLGLFLVLPLQQSAKADSLEDAARALARRAAAFLHGSTVTCEVQNLSSMESAEFVKVSAAFEEELQQRGVKIASRDASAALVVNVTQNPTEYLGVVQVRKKEGTQTLMESLGGIKGPTAAELAFELALRRELLFTQESPILDVVFAGDGKVMFAVGTEEIASYQRRDEGGWVRSSVERLPRQQAPARSERGYLFFGEDLETVSFSGETCHIYAASGKGWSCERTRGQEMQVRSLADADLAGKRTGRWISAARFEANGNTKMVLTGSDGIARTFGKGAEPLAAFAGWGSEIASVHSGCGKTGWQVLRTGVGDWTKGDTVQATEINEGRAEAVSTAMEFPGAIVALHTPGMRVEDGSGQSRAMAVDRNLQTGWYEVYLISVSCGN